MEPIDVRIHETAIVKNLLRTGSHVCIDAFVYCSTMLWVGSNVHIAPHVSIIGGIHSSLYLGDFAGLSTHATAICGGENFATSLLGIVPDKYRDEIYGHNIMEDYAWMGAGSIMMPNLIMAEGSVLGAGAILTHNTEPWTIYVGNPARVFGKRDRDRVLRQAEQYLKDNEHKP